MPSSPKEESIRYAQMACLLDSAHSTRLTFDAGDNRYSIWSPDGSQVVYSSKRKGVYDLYVKPADGSGVEQELLASSNGKTPRSWSRDGRFILYESAQNAGDLIVLPLGGDRKPYPFLSTPFREIHGVFSPDGKWVAYTSNDSGRFEVYVRPFPGPGGVYQISAGGGGTPRWKADGKELYYVAPGNRMMATAISARGGSLVHGQPSALFTADTLSGGAGPQYDVARDGRFLLNTQLPDTSTTTITLLQNWKPPK
jgi:hypothetical protein